MKEYKQILLILSKVLKPAQRQNKLLEFAMATEDSKLAELCRSSARMYGYYIEPRYSRVESYVKNPDWKEGMNPDLRTIMDRTIPYNNESWKRMQSEVNSELTKYVESLLLENKPGWQVEAERNGWVKPSGK